VGGGCRDALHDEAPSDVELLLAVAEWTKSREAVDECQRGTRAVRSASLQVLVASPPPRDPVDRRLGGPTADLSSLAGSEHRQNDHAQRFKKSFTVVLQMLLCGECYGNRCAIHH
jgi:hypothetical protein